MALHPSPLLSKSIQTPPLNSTTLLSSSHNPSLSTQLLKPHFLNYPLKQCTKKLSTTTKVSFFPSFLTKSKDVKVLKQELLEAIKPLDRGVDATPDDQLVVDQLARKLEAVNPTREPLKSDLLNGKWELMYTTSKSILQKERPKFLRSRINYQAINLDTLRAQNMETWPFFNQVTANLKPINSRKVSVQFDYFKILGLIPVKAPERTQYGSLDITYLDEDLRVSRGDKGNLFVLKMVDRSYRVST